MLSEGISRGFSDVPTQMQHKNDAVTALALQCSVIQGTLGNARLDFSGTEIFQNHNQHKFVL